MRVPARARFKLKHLIPLALSLAAGLVSGCAHAPRQNSQSGFHPLSPEEEAVLDQRVDALAHYATGISAELNSQPADATDEFLQAALSDPHEETLVLETARRLIREQKNDAAIELLKKASADPDADGSTYALLGLAYLQAGNTNLALEANQQSVKHAPDNLAGYQNLAALHLESSRTNDALAVIEQAVGRTNASPEFLLGTVDLLTRYNRQRLISDEEARSKTLRLLDAAAIQDSENPVIQQRIADLYLLHGQGSKAEPIYAALLEKYPSIPGLRERLAKLYISTDQHDKAARLLEQIRKDNPTDVSTYFFLGSIAYEAKDYDKAAENYETALRLNPDFEPLYYDLAGVQIARKEPAEALALLEKARGKFKLNFIMEFYTGIAQSILTNWPEALSHLTSAELIAKTSEPSRLNHIFYYQLGAAYEQSGNVPDAVKALRKSLELSPDYAEALNYLGYMWAERGENLKEAHSMLQRASALEPENAAILDSLAWVLYKLGRPADALVPMNKAIQLSKEPDATLLDHLGDIELALTHQDKAREAYTKSIALKADEKVKQKLDRLLPR